MNAAALLLCTLLGLAAASADDEVVNFITEPQDATVPPGGWVQMDCELVDEDVCAWRVNGTNLGVDHFYNVLPPPKVHALFPDHERVCSIIIEDIDWRYDGYWTCWPLGTYSHYSSRAARITVSGSPVTTPGPEPPTTTPDVPTTTPEPPTTTPEAPTTTPEPPTTTPEAPTTTPEAPTTTPEAPTTTPEAPTTTPEAPTTTPVPWTTSSPGPDFVCPQPFGLYADPLDNRYFYYCENGIAIHLQCEYPMHWDDTNKTCA